MTVLSRSKNAASTGPSQGRADVADRYGCRIVDGSTRQVEYAVVGSSGLRFPGIDVERVVLGEAVTVTVLHLARTDVPLVGMLLPDVVLSATVSMRRKRTGGWQRHPGGTTVVYRWGGRNSRRGEIRCSLTSTVIHATTA